jgi:hypothetical protein
MTVYAPVCTCAIPGITGCAVHAHRMTDYETQAIAELIRDGIDPYTDEDAARVAAAFLELARR